MLREERPCEPCRYLDRVTGQATAAGARDRFSKVDNRPTSSNELIDAPNGDVGLTAGADTAASAAAAAGAADAGPVDNPNSPPTAIDTAAVVTPIPRKSPMPIHRRGEGRLID